MSLFSTKNSLVLGSSWRDVWAWRWTRKTIGILSHPISIFVTLQAVCVAITVLWVIWFVNQYETIQEANQRIGAMQTNQSFGLGLLIAGCILLGVLIVGVCFLFIFAQRQRSINAQQKNFISSVTHELRSPLASLRLGFETLANVSSSQATTEKVLMMIESDIERLSRLVDQILLSARLDRGLHVFDKAEVFSVKEEFADAIARSTYLDPDSFSRIKVECPDALALTGNKGAFALIIGNLIENAIKYSPKGSPISASVALDDSGNSVHLTIQDQGFGLHKNERKRIFKMFQRSPTARTKAISGTGLGLFIVRTMCRSLGGKVWAESDGLGKGSTFRVILPVSDKLGLSQG